MLKTIHQAPLKGSCRIWLYDEAHQLSRRDNGDAQTALLKVLEDTPKHCYFFLCTTDPGQLLPTIVNRCTHFKLKPLDTNNLKKLIASILEKEEVKFSSLVIDKVAEASEGSARRCLKILESLVSLKTDEERLESLDDPESKDKAKTLCQLLMNKKTKWPEVAEVLKNLTESPEDLRRMILGYASAVLLKGTINPRAYLILLVFGDNTFSSGKPGLVRMAYEVFKED